MEEVKINKDDYIKYRIHSLTKTFYRLLQNDNIPSHIMDTCKSLYDDVTTVEHVDIPKELTDLNLNEAILNFVTEVRNYSALLNSLCKNKILCVKDKRKKHKKRIKKVTFDV